MNKFPRWAMLAAVMSLGYLFPWPWPGPGRSAMGQPMAGSRIALLDVSRIFKNHQRFKSRMEEMKADVERAEANVKKESEEIVKQTEDLKMYQKGTREYKDAETSWPPAGPTCR